MLKNEPFSRKDFDAAMTTVFPNAVRSRKELDFGWTDTINLNLIEVRVTVYSERRGFMRPGDVMIELRGVRLSTDGSSATLWSRRATKMVGLREALLELKNRLMGVTAALLHICGDPSSLPKPAVGPAPKPKIPPEDAGKMVDDIFK